MLKFLRKYNKWILVFGGVLLMIAFIAPQAIRQLGPKRENQVVAKLGKKPVTQGQLDLASREFAALAQFSPALVYFTLGLPQNTRADHWLLLTEAAERGGFVAEGGDGLSWIPDLAKRQLEIQYAQMYNLQMRVSLDNPQMAQQVDQIQQTLFRSRTQAAGRAGFTLPQFDKTLAKARGVVRMLEAYGTSPRFGEETIIRRTKHDQDRAFADVLWISGAQAAAVEQIKPTEEQIKAQFDTFRDQRPGDNKYGLGYTLPQRVKLSWIEIDPEAMGKEITPDPIEVAKAWEQDRTKYPGDLADERENIVKALQQRQAERLVAEADRVIRERTAAALRQIERLGELPGNWDELCPTWDQLAEEISAATTQVAGQPIGMPTVLHHDSTWLTRDDLLRLPGIGTARVRLGAREIPFADAALSVRALGNKQGLGFRVGVPVVQAYAVDSASHKRYYFTIDAARDVSPPDSIDEIHDRLERETAAFLAFQRLKDNADQLLTEAEDVGLAAIAERYSPKPTESTDDNSAQEAGQISVQPQVAVKWDPDDRGMVTTVPELRTQSFCDAVMGRATTLDPMLQGDELPANRRWLVVSVPEHQGIALVKINAYAQITREEFERYAGSSIQRARRDIVVGEGAPSPFGYDTLAKRMGYARTHEDEGESDKAGSDKPETDRGDNAQTGSGEPSDDQSGG